MVAVTCEGCGKRQRIGIFDRMVCRSCGSERLIVVDDSSEE